MREKILTVAAAVALSGIVYTGCNTSSQGASNADTTTNVAPAKPDTVSEIQKFKQANETRIAEHQRQIEELKTQIEKEKKSVRKENLKQLKTAENKNQELRKRLDSIQGHGQETMKAFMADFDRDMNDVSNTIKSLSAKTTNNESKDKK